MAVHPIPLPEHVLSRAESLVSRSGLYPEVETMVSEACVRFAVSARNGEGPLKEAVARYGTEASGAVREIRVRMPVTAYTELYQLSEVRRVNMFAVAVLAQADRLFGIS